MAYLKLESSILDNKLLAIGNETVLYSNRQVIGGKGIIRDADLDLGIAVASVAKRDDGNSISSIELYADSITAHDKVDLPSDCQVLTIFARNAFSAGESVKLSTTNDVLVIEIYTSSWASKTFSFQLTTSGKAQDISLTFADGSAGARAIFQAGSDITYESLEPSAEHFDFMSLTDQILDNGKAQSLGVDLAAEKVCYHPILICAGLRMCSNLSRLLNYQLLLATTVQDANPAAAFALVSFVVQQTQGIPKALEIFSQACAMATSTVAATPDSLSRLVPAIDLSAVQQVLQSRLQAALAFETAYQAFSAKQDNAENITMFANVALQASLDTDRTYDVLARMTKGRYDAAQQALQLAQTNFQALQLTMEAKQNTFKDGIEKWKKKEIGKCVAAAVIGVVAVVGTIAVAVVFPPAAAVGVAEAGAAIPAVTAAADAVKETVSTIDKIVTTLKALFEKLKPGLEKLDKLTEAVKATLELLKKMKAVDAANPDGGSMPSLKLGDDEINLSADWDIFGTQMTYLYNSLKDNDIAGADDYFLMMAELVIRAKAVLAAQTAVATTGDAYVVTVTQQLASERQTKRLQAAISSIRGNPYALRIFKLNMLDRLLSVRAWITLDFKQYVAALEWYSLRKDRVIRIDPMKPIEEFAADAAALQAQVAQVGASIRAQSRTFKFDSQTPTSAITLVNGWIQTLMNTRRLEFNIDIAHPCFSGIGRIRMLSFALFLDGVSSSSTVDMLLQLGSDMLDLPLDSPESAATPLGASTRALAYTIADHKFQYEYVPATSEILVAGSLRDLRSCPLSSPFRKWSAIVGPAADLKNVKGLRLEVSCEFSLAF